eukprot:1187080-Prorocentrum_minimum.AAC.1
MECGGDADGGERLSQSSHCGESTAVDLISRGGAGSEQHTGGVYRYRSWFRAVELFFPRWIPHDTGRQADSETKFRPALERLYSPCAS